ncbi:MAG TPA: hypothetical protein DEH78_08635 [Solibacterales bacterium]|nr:hypothetical protein [Bryobacterales bacterium]
MAALVAGLACNRAPMNVQDGFETLPDKSLWRSRKFAPGAVEAQSAVVRSGRQAAKITLRHGDWSERNDTPGGPVLERAELEESPDLWSAEDQAYEQAFSVWLPADFPVAPVRLVIAQWKQKCPHDGCTPGNPLVAVRYSGGELRVTAGPERKTLYRTSEEIRNRWLDFRFRLRFSAGEKGRLQMSLNDRPVADYTGPLTYPASGGYPAGGNRFYFKIGLYRDETPQPMTIVIDDYYKRELSGEPF